MLTNSEIKRRQHIHKAQGHYTINKTEDRLIHATAQMTHPTNICYVEETRHRSQVYEIDKRQVGEGKLERQE